MHRIGLSRNEVKQTDWPQGVNIAGFDFGMDIQVNHFLDYPSLNVSYASPGNPGPQPVPRPHPDTWQRPQ